MAVGPKRVWLPHADSPGLSMTRAFGDQLGASVGISAEPEITQVDALAMHTSCSREPDFIGNVFALCALNLEIQAVGDYTQRCDLMS